MKSIGIEDSRKRVGQHNNLKKKHKEKISCCYYFFARTRQVLVGRYTCKLATQRVFNYIETDYQRT